MSQVVLAVGLSLIACGLSQAQAIGRNYGRSMVISQEGIVATSQVLASQAGAQILARGGSAVDAANSVQCSASRHRTDDDRARRRFVRALLGRQDWQADRT
jgi:hypothetical protein